MKPLHENQIAFIVIILIAVIFLFPAFLGFVDTPVDIRNVRMYPWRYHTVDKQIKNTTLWQANLPKEQMIVDPETMVSVFALKTPPKNTGTIVSQVNWDKLLQTKSSKLSDINYYISFDFKTISDSSVTFDLGITLLNNINNSTYTPGVALTPLFKNKDGIVSWYRALYPLNNFLKQLKSLKNLDQYSVQIIVKNKSNSSSSLVYIKDFKLTCEDFSKVLRVHNHYNNDLIQMFTPLREFFSESIKKGKLPFWNHYILTGAEFLAEPQVGFFHPLYFLSYLVFDHFTAHEILTFVCLILCGLGAFLLCRQWKLNFAASLLAALVYMFQPFNVTWFSYEHMLMNSAAFPFLLLSYEKNLNNKNILNKYLLFSALLLGLIFISGHLQYIYYTVIFFVLFAVFRGASARLAFTKHLFSILFIFGTGLMIGAVVLVPFFPLFQASHRTVNPPDLVRASSVPLKTFLGLLYPFYKGIPDWPLSGAVNQTSEYMHYKSGFARNYVYFGLLPFIFSLFCFRFFKNKLVLFFIFLIIFSLLICMGSPLFFVIRNFLPGFKEMQHYRFLQIYSYCVPFLAGFGFQAACDYFSFLKPVKKILIFVFIFLISAADLIYFSSYFVTWSDRVSYKSIPKDGILDFIITEQKKSKEPFRILPFISHQVEGASIKPDIAEPNTLLPFKLEDVSGYSSFIPKDIYYTFVYIQTMASKRLYSGEIFDLFSNINTPYPISNFHSMILDLLNVKYFLVPNFLILKSNKVKKVFEGDSTIYENKNYLPRVFFVENYKIIKDPKNIIVELDSPNFDPRKEIILKEEISFTARSRLGRKGDSPCSQSVQVKYDLNNITININVNRSGFLVLNNNLNENWKVKINGKENKHFQANLLQRAVFLPKADSYLIEFYYSPKKFVIGGIVSGFALLILLTLAAFLTLGAKKPR
ncbi:MAG: hypothetical protein A3I68_02650 [Candidatus Melainabacteria bacterium RIFCSPLOWO2_02_FULL_35_15]|nr:MAG: hypothetical protein A3I68_02650 [Candidatus Melainabacteria bacterium RIFCSPLOWO2_02_FULL_35_15]